MLKHEDCGGELKKYGKKGKYLCILCRKIVKVGRFGGFGPGYIQKQTRKA